MNFFILEMDFSSILKEKNREELEKLAGDEDQINEIVLNSEPIQHLFMEKDLSKKIAGFRLMTV